MSVQISRKDGADLVVRANELWCMIAILRPCGCDEEGCYVAGPMSRLGGSCCMYIMVPEIWTGA